MASDTIRIDMKGAVLKPGDKVLLTVKEDISDLEMELLNHLKNHLPGVEVIIVAGVDMAVQRGDGK